MNMNLKIQIPQNVKFIFEKLEQRCYEVYLVGGCVRDSLLGKPIKDYDIITNATISQIKEIFKEYRFAKREFEHYGTATLILNGKCFDISSYEEGLFTADMLDRDFTINSIAYHPDRGYMMVSGYPMSDLENKIIRMNSPRCFKKNPVRILRALRFASVYGFKIEEKTAEEIHSCLPELFPKICKENRTRELLSILDGKNILEVMLEFKDVFSYLIPELKVCIDFKQNNPYHKHDVYEHIAHVVASTIPNAEARFAALCHDIGKPLSYFEEITPQKERRGHFYGHPVVSKNLCELYIFDRFCFSKEFKKNVSLLIENHGVEIPTTKRTLNKLYEKFDCSLELFQKFLSLRNADRLDHIYPEGTKLESLEECYKMLIKSIENSPFNLRSLEINGKDLLSLGFPQSKKIGEILNAVYSLVKDELLENKKEILLEYVKKEYGGA